MTARTHRHALALLVCLLVGSCAADAKLTQIMVVVRSNITALDNVDIQVDGMGAPKLAHADLKGHPLPRTLAVVHEGGKLGPITITARGRMGKTTLVERTAKLSFVLGRNVALVLDLNQDCAIKLVTCNAAKGQTCIAGTCMPNTVDAKRLQDWPGSVAKLKTAKPGAQDGGLEGGAADASSDAAADGGGIQAPDTGAHCPAGYGQCAGDTACTTKLDTIDHCGACDTMCALDKGVTDGRGSFLCKSGSCRLSCDSGYADIDGDLGNGCEGSGFAFTPSNIDLSAAPLQNLSKPALTLSCDATIDTSAMVAVTLCGTSVQPVVLKQASGPELFVLALASLDLPAAHTLKFVGSRPVALLVFGDVQVDGTLDVSALGSTAGAGGGAGCTTGQGGKGPDASTSGGLGGGGGGFGSAGGAGGRVANNSTSPGGKAGAIEGNANLVPLRGGCSGGIGGDGSSSGSGSGAGGDGGSGGGAIQLSVAGTLTVSGSIAAGGGGGLPSGASLGGAGGGGSGGAILLEGAHVMLESSGWLSANGGGGAGGNQGGSGSSAIGTAGADGIQASSLPAQGGSGAGGSNEGGDGGDGAAEGSAAANGGNGGGFPFPQAGCGGAGGGVGRIHVRSPVACTMAGMASPAADIACP